MRIAIAYNQPKPSGPAEHWMSRSSSQGTVIPETFEDASEHGVLLEAQAIESFLRDAGFQTLLYAVRDPGELLDFLKRERPDLIFNCCESVQGNAKMFSYVFPIEGSQLVKPRR